MYINLFDIIFRMVRNAIKFGVGFGLEAWNMGINNVHESLTKHHGCIGPARPGQEKASLDKITEKLN